MVNKVSFFTPVYFPSDKKTWKQKAGEALDGFFDINFNVDLGPVHFSLGSKRAYVVPKFNVKGTPVVKIENAPAPKQGVIKTALKIALFVPVLILKGLYRLMNSFYTSDAVDFMLQRQKATEELLKGCLSNSVPIESGYGEYIVFHHSKDGKTGVSLETYKKAEQVFKTFRQQLFEKGLQGQTPQQQHENLCQRIKLIDGTLDIQFIPKTLYELAFIKGSIQKEIDKKQNFHDWSLYPSFNPSRPDFQNRECVKLSDRDHYQKIAFEFNNELVRQIAKRVCTFGQMTYFAHEQMKYLQKLADKDSDIFKAVRQVENRYGDVHEPLSPYFMQINCFQTEEQKSMIINAMALECSSVGREGVLLYRGGNLLSDAPDDPSAKAGLSYGTSLFAGIFYDKSASAFEYSKGESRDAYVYSIPYDAMKSDAFKVWKTPNDPPLYQMAGCGEEFHARSRDENSARYLVGNGRHNTDARRKFNVPVNSRAYLIKNSV